MQLPNDILFRIYDKLSIVQILELYEASNLSSREKWKRFFLELSSRYLNLPLNQDLIDIFDSYDAPLVKKFLRVLAYAGIAISRESAEFFESGELLWRLLLCGRIHEFIERPVTLNINDISDFWKRKIRRILKNRYPELLSKINLRLPITENSGNIVTGAILARLPGLEHKINMYKYVKILNHVYQMYPNFAGLNTGFFREAYFWYKCPENHLNQFRILFQQCGNTLRYATVAEIAKFMSKMTEAYIDKIQIILDYMSTEEARKVKGELMLRININNPRFRFCYGADNIPNEELDLIKKVYLQNYVNTNNPELIRLANNKVIGFCLPWEHNLPLLDNPNIARIVNG